MTTHRIAYNQRLRKYRVERRVLFWWTGATEPDPKCEWNDPIPVTRDTMDECEEWISKGRKLKNRWEPVERMTNL